MLRGEENVIAADSSFFHVFDFPIVAGQNNNLLSGPSGIILEKKAAEIDNLDQKGGLPEISFRDFPHVLLYPQG